MQQFNAVLGGKLHQLIYLTDTDVYVEKLTNTFNTATEVLGNCQSNKNQWMTDAILALCDERCKLKKLINESHSTSEYRKCNNTIKNMQEAKQIWIQSKYSEIEINLISDTTAKRII